MPLARMILSISQSCSSNRRTCGSPRLPRTGWGWRTTFIASLPCFAVEAPTRMLVNAAGSANEGQRLGFPNAVARGDSSVRPLESGDPALVPWIPAFAGMNGLLPVFCREAFGWGLRLLELPRRQHLRGRSRYRAKQSMADSSSELTVSLWRGAQERSEERRVGKEGRSRWSPYH